MTSYQRLKQKNAYLQQCVTELEQKCKELVSQLPPGTVRIMHGEGVHGDQFLTPYNNGEFDDILGEWMRNPAEVSITKLK